MTLDEIFPPSKAGASDPPPASPAEIKALAEAASAALNELQTKLGRAAPDFAKVTFPRGYLRTAGRWRLALGFLRSNNIRNNVAYTLMTFDVQSWVLRRTDLAGHARDMLVKSCIATLGNIAEAILSDATSGTMGNRQRVASRIKRLLDTGIIDASLHDELCWLWDVRNRQHLQDLDSREFDFYTDEDLPRAEAAVSELIRAMQASGGAG